MDYLRNTFNLTYDHAKLFVINNTNDTILVSLFLCVITALIVLLLVVRTSRLKRQLRAVKTDLDQIAFSIKFLEEQEQRRILVQINEKRKVKREAS